MPDGPLQQNDQFLVNRNNETYKVEKSQFTATQTDVNEGLTDTKFVTPSTLSVYLTDQLKGTWLPNGSDLNPWEDIVTSTWGGSEDSIFLPTLTTGINYIEFRVADPTTRTYGPWYASSEVDAADIGDDVTVIQPSEGIEVESGSQIQARWNQVVVRREEHNTALAGRIENEGTNIDSNYNTVLKKKPDLFTITPITGAPFDSVQTSESITPTGINAPYKIISLNLTGGLTDAEVSVGGGAFETLQTAFDNANVTFIYPPGSSTGGTSFRLRATTDDTPGQVAELQFRIGTEEDSDDVNGEGYINRSFSITNGFSTIDFDAIISGDIAIGSVVTAEAQNITGGENPTQITYQWQRDGIDITGETNETYTTVSADLGTTLTCNITVSEPDGSGAVTKTSNELVIASAIDFDIVISGSTSVGGTLTCVVDNITGGTDPDTATTTFQWKRNGTDIAGETNETYTTVNDDVGQTIICTGTVTDSQTYVGNSTTKDSNGIVPTPIIATPEILTPPKEAGLGDGSADYLTTTEIIQVDPTPGDNGEAWEWSQPATNGGITKLGRFVRSLGGRTVAFERETGDLIYNDGLDLNVGWQINSSGAAIERNGIILQGVLQGSGTLLATSGKSNAYVSTDGDIWTATSLNIPNINNNHEIQSGLYSTRLHRFFVMSRNTSGGVSLWASNVDGNLESRWEEISLVSVGVSSADLSINEVIVDGSSYILMANGNAGNIAFLQDGETVSTISTPLSDVGNVSYTSGILVASDRINDRIAFSTDFGQTWTDYAAPVDPLVIKSYQNGFILVSRDNDGTVMKSSDGENWTEYPTPVTHSVAFGGLEFSASGLVISANSVDGVNSNGFLWSSLGYTDLTFQDSENFDQFEVGTPTGLPDGSKTCEVLAIDATDSTMRVLTEDTFVANSGEVLQSNTDASDPPPGADTLIFTATPYEDTPENSTTPGLATWDVATSEDFSTGLMTDTKTVVRDVINELTPAERVNISLEDDTEYYVRVTYSNADSSVSATSETHHFKTDVGGPPAGSEITLQGYIEKKGRLVSAQGRVEVDYPSWVADCNLLVCMVWVDSTNVVEIAGNTYNYWERHIRYMSDKPSSAVFSAYDENTFAHLAGTTDRPFHSGTGNTDAYNHVLWGFNITGDKAFITVDGQASTGLWNVPIPTQDVLDSSGAAEYYGLFGNSARPQTANCVFNSRGEPTTEMEPSDGSLAKAFISEKLNVADGVPGQYSFNVNFDNKGRAYAFWIGSAPTIFYNENTRSAITQHDLALNYGLNKSMPELGIYRLTDYPSYPVSAYVKQGDKYQPIRDYSTEIEELQSRVTGIESDEIVDDAVDNSLITLLGQLAARVDELEQNS